MSGEHFSDSNGTGDLAGLRERFADARHTAQTSRIERAHLREERDRLRGERDQALRENHQLRQELAATRVIAGMMTAATGATYPPAVPDELAPRREAKAARMRGASSAAFTAIAAVALFAFPHPVGSSHSVHHHRRRPPVTAAARV